MEVQPEYISMWRAIIYFVLCILCTFGGFYPLSKFIFEDDASYLFHLSENAVLMNFFIDLMITMINLSFSMKFYLEYQELFMVISLLQFFSLLMKMRTFLSFSENQGNQLNEEAQNKIKLYAMLKLMIVFMSTMFLNKYFMQYYWIFAGLFVYPILQVFHNAFHVVSKNCFSFKIHFLLYYGLIFYPLAMRFKFFDFFQLHSDNVFILVSFGITTFFVFLMGMQRIFGRSFFLPKCLNPNYYEYMFKIQSLADQNEKCPICFLELSQPVEDDNDALTKKLIQSHFM